MEIDITQSIKESKWYNARYKLPLILNNPWIYLAYFDKILCQYNGSHFNQTDIDLFLWACESIYTGVYHRYPLGQGGIISHDELIGIAYLSCEGTSRIIYKYLRKNWGYYNNIDVKSKSIKEFFHYNKYRFPWAVAYIKSRAGIELSYYDRISVVLFYIYDIILGGKKGDADAFLLRWLMIPEFRYYKLVDYIIKKWVEKCYVRNITPKTVFDYYLSEEPLFKKLAGNLIW